MMSPAKFPEVHGARPACRLRTLAVCDFRSSSRSREKSKTFLTHFHVPCCVATDSLIFLIFWDINTAAEMNQGDSRPESDG